MAAGSGLREAVLASSWSKGEGRKAAQHRAVYGKKQSCTMGQTQILSHLLHPFLSLCCCAPVPRRGAPAPHSGNRWAPPAVPPQAQALPPSDCHLSAAAEVSGEEGRRKGNETCQADTRRKLIEEHTEDQRKNRQNVGDKDRYYMMIKGLVQKV